MVYFEFHRQVASLKDSYAPFNPDSDTQLVRLYSAEEKKDLQSNLVSVLTEVLNAANFKKNH
jgi:hypothetical protein